MNTNQLPPARETITIEEASRLMDAAERACDRERRRANNCDSKDDGRRIAFAAMEKYRVTVDRIKAHIDAATTVVDVRHE